MGANKNINTKTNKTEKHSGFSEEDKKRIEEQYREKVTANSSFPLSEIFYEDPRTVKGPEKRK